MRRIILILGFHDHFYYDQRIKTLMKVLNKKHFKVEKKSKNIIKDVNSKGHNTDFWTFHESALDIESHWMYL